MMSTLASDLRKMGFTRTDRQSPFDDDGMLWANSHELVCDETGYVIRSHDDSTPSNDIAELSDNAPRYTGSNIVILPGGNQYAYHWGSEDNEFVYDKNE